MITNYTHTAVERFLKYVTIDTQSDPVSNAFPSTDKQKNMSELLVKELQEMGIENACTDVDGYVYATIPANTAKQVAAICFCSHIDTAPDCSGTNVKPILHQHYNGAAIVLPDDNTQVITVEKYPYLQQHIGNNIITASGKTLLGADDKSGVAIIMDMANYLMQNPTVPHGKIVLLFTPDEEVGRGTEKLAVAKLQADYAYTLDGGEAGSYEEETFSADAATITINGVIAHPGYGKNVLINALKIAGEILAALPKDGWSPETTEGREGFVHPVSINGISEKACIDFIIRDFETAQLTVHANKLKSIAENVVAKYAGATMEFAVKEQYRNMKQVLDQHPNIAAYAEIAYKNVGLPFNKAAIRGGTDGSKLSFMGLPTANIFTGMQAIHSKHEWIGVKDMLAAVAVLVQLVQVWEQKGVK